MLIAVPSFALLYSIEEFIEPSLTVKCTGHQWYWCYEYSNCKERMRFFKEQNVISSLCHNCFKVQILNLNKLSNTYTF